MLLKPNVCFLFPSLVVTLRLENGVDVFVIHPGGVNTSFYDNAPNIFLLSLLRTYSLFLTIELIDCLGFIGQTPDNVADIILSNLGRTVSLDSGLFAFICKAIDKVFGPNCTVPAIRFVLKFLHDMDPIFKTTIEKKDQ